VHRSQRLGTRRLNNLAGDVQARLGANFCPERHGTLSTFLGEYFFLENLHQAVCGHFEGMHGNTYAETHHPAGIVQLVIAIRFNTQWASLP
jgi:hypothetical protein